MHMTTNLGVGLAKNSDKSKENYWHYFPKPGIMRYQTSGCIVTVTWSVAGSDVMSGTAKLIKNLLLYIYISI